MLYVYHGSNMDGSLNKARALVDSLRAKRPDATYIEAIADNWSSSVIEENIGGQGLFSSKYIIFLNRVTENAEAKEVLPDLIQMMNESTNIFIVLEGKLNADLKKAVEKYAEKAVETEESTEGKKGKGKDGTKENFNIFALADAVGSKNVLKSWVLYREAIDNGLEAENIIGVLFWKLKMMMSSKRFGAYSERELSGLITDLVTIYHDGHRGLLDMEMAIEGRLLGLA